MKNVPKGEVKELEVNTDQVKLSNGEIFNYFAAEGNMKLPFSLALEKLQASFSGNGKLVYSIYALLDEMEKIFAKIQKSRTALVKEYSELDEKGEPKVRRVDRGTIFVMRDEAGFNREFNAMMLEENVLPVKKLKIYDYMITEANAKSHSQVLPMDLLVLKPVITFTLTEDPPG